MFARIKGAIDSQIAAEQAKLRTQRGSPASTPGGLSRSSSRARNGASPSNEVQKDPAEFEDSDAATPSTSGTPARVGTPVQGEAVTADPLGATGVVADDGKEKEKDDKEKPADAGVGEKAAVTPATSTNRPAASLASNPDLPTEVRVKLRKLEKIEGKYAELLRSYKIVHARNALIDPFEKALRENTPVESIADPKSLIDYINSFSLRSDMVKEELIRVSKEKDEYKASLQTSKEELAAKEKELVELRAKKASSAPKSDDIFDFDQESQELSTKVEELEGAILSLKAELEAANQAKKVAEEAVEGMQRSVENAQSELEGLRETASAKDGVISGLRKDVEQAEKQVNELNAKIETLSKEIDDVRKEADARAKETEEHLASSTASAKELADTKKDLEDKTNKLDAEIKTSEQLRKTVKGQIEQLVKFQNQARELADTTSKLDASTQELTKLRSAKTDLERAVAKLEGQLQEQSTQGPTTVAQVDSNATSRPSTPAGDNAGGGGGKKKNKKKKKGKGGPAATATAMPEEAPVKESETVEEESEQSPPTASFTSESIITDLQTQLEQLKEQLDAKDSRISNLIAKQKDADALREEIESLRDDLINVGQDHVVTRQKLKDQSKEMIELGLRKQELEATVEKLEGEIRELEGKSKGSEETEKAYHTLKTDFSKLQESTSSLQTDLLAAQRLAETRFKELTEVRSMIDKMQPELASLRTENATLTSSKNDLTKQLGELKRLERTERDLKNDLQILSKKMADKDSEIVSLRKQKSEEASRRLKSEEEAASVQKDLRRVEADRKNALDTAERLKGELSHAQEEISSLKTKIAALEKELKTIRGERDDLKEELELKAAQLDSSQNLMNSMRDQTSELAMQTREAQEQRESIEEELAEAQRLLTERTREAETMRRMLSEMETRHEARSREMKERIDALCDERDKAEEEVATIGRRRSREIEELKDKLRDVERGLRRAEEARELAEKQVGGLRDTKLRMEETLERERRELEDTKKAMSSMTSALDDTDGQVREIERQKTELRKRAEQAEEKLEKLQKQHRILQDEVRSIQTMRAKAIDNERPASASRTSVDSARSSSRPMSPRPSISSGTVDLVYLKNVLLQFMELKDKNRQKDLIPALKMLLDLDSKEERKWIQVVQAR